MKNYLKLMRVKHWLKNLLIFLPIFFSKNLFDYNKIYLCLLGFIIFSFTSSIVYIINDINDFESDKIHELKKNRPLASGIISIKQGKTLILVLSLLLIIASFSLFNITLDYFIFIFPIMYLIINLFYSVSLKHIAILDVVVIATGFLLRTMYGGVIISVSVSKWLYLMIIFGSFYLAFGKRRNEIIKSGKDSRKVLQYYNKDFLDKNMYVCLTLSMMSYTLWCVDKDTISRIGHDYLFWTIPILMIIFLMYSLNIEGDSHGDPIEVILNDKILLSLISIYVFIICIFIYAI